MSDRDEIFSSAEPPRVFVFDERVARVLPDMLQRSIPGYEALLGLIGVLADRAVAPHSRVYDLGCSLGAATFAVRGAIGNTPAELVAVDSSPAMVERCRTLLDSAPGRAPVEVKVGDLRTEPISNASLVLFNFTLQFVPPDERDRVLASVARGLRPGGFVVVSEKTHAENGEQEQLLAELHDAFRLRNGYSEMELAKKRQALERILVTDDPATIAARLERAGLEATEWFRCLGFVSFLGRKA